MLNHLKPLRIAIFGVGALGLFFAGRLSAAGQKVTVVTRRGARLSPPIVIEEAGIIEHCAALHFASSDVASPQDLLIVTVKAHQLADALPDIRRWMDERTQMILAQNGLPWWYSPNADGKAGGRLQRCDPNGFLSSGIDLQKTIAGVVHTSAERRGDTHVVTVNSPSDRLILGRPLGGDDDILQNVAALFKQARLRVETNADLRQAIWEKLLANVVLNPLSVITGSDIGSMLFTPESRSTLINGLTEAYAVAVASGTRPVLTPHERLSRMEKDVARHQVRTSMLQDLSAGKALEIDAIVGAVLELARQRAISTPTLDALYTGAIAKSQRQKSIAAVNQGKQSL